jgi:transcriptional regulator with XRE-family HTH domain
MTIGQLIKHHRERLGLTQARLAERANIPQSRVSELETGKIDDPSLSLVQSVARGLGMRASTLVRGLESRTEGPA